MHGSYGFERYARPKINAAIIITGALLAVLATCELCRNALPPQAPMQFGRPRPDITIQSPFGEYKIYGAQDWIEPLIEQGRMMNKIEALENHNQFEHLSPNPEDYIK